MSELRASCARRVSWCHGLEWTGTYGALPDEAKQPEQVNRQELAQLKTGVQARPSCTRPWVRRGRDWTLGERTAMTEMSRQAFRFGAASNEV